MRYSEIFEEVYRFNNPNGVVVERYVVSRLDVDKTPDGASLGIVSDEGRPFLITGTRGAMMSRYIDILRGDDPDFEMGGLPATIDWMEPKSARRQIETGELAVAWVDPQKIDKSFSQSDLYVGRDGDGGIGKRYAQFDGWVRQGLAVEMPECYLGEHSREVDFVNGRHRFAWMRDHGVRAIAVVIPADQVDDFQSRFASDEQFTRLT